MTNPTKLATILPKTRTAIENHDHSYINHLPTIADRGAAIARRLEEVKANPKYQALDANKQAAVRADLYKKFVVPSYAGHNLPLPDEKTWVGATARDTNHLVNRMKYSDTFGVDNKSNYWGYYDNFMQDVSMGLDKGLANIQIFGAKIANRAFLDTFSLMDHFSHNDQVNAPQKYQDELKKYDTPKVLNNFISAQKAKVQTADFWLQTHPRDTVIGRLGGTVGEQIAQLPLYEAVSVEKIGATIGIPLTAKLIKSPIGKWVASRFINATDGYLASLAVSGGNNKEALSGAAGFATLGAVSEVLGKVGTKIASNPLIKKWTANTIAMAGKPFAEELAKSAMAEEEFEDSHTGEGLEQIKRSEQIKDFIHQTQESAEARATRTKLVQEWQKAQEERARLDPVMHKLHQGEKVSLNSIAIALHDKPLSALSKNQRGMVLAKRMQLIGQAASEAPVHLPDLHHDEVQENIDNFRKSSPIANSLMGDLEKMGVKFADAVTENNTEQIARETGIVNNSAAANKVQGVAKASKALKGESITPQKFVSMKADSVAYLRAPRNRTQVAEAVSDRSEVGLNKFIDVLKKSSPAIHFEDPAHLMLYHYGNRKDLPEGLQRTLLYRLKQVKGNEFASAKDLKTSADWLHVHLLNMAKSGRLAEEGNIYRSSKLGGGPMSWTKWQRMLSTEADHNDIDLTLKALKNHPKAAKAFAAAIKTLQKTKPNIQTPEEYVLYTKQLNTTADVYHKAATVANKNPFIF
jgi:hypothetical protein